MRDVSVQEVPVAKCDVEVARKYLTLAKEKYEEKEITEANLFNAIRYLKEGQEYLIACKDTAMKDELNEALKSYSNELDAVYSRLMFNTKKALKLKDSYSAKVELQRVLLFFPDPSDPRNLKAQDLLKKVGAIAP